MVRVDQVVLLLTIGLIVAPFSIILPWLLTPTAEEVEEEYASPLSGHTQKVGSGPKSRSPEVNLPP